MTNTKLKKIIVVCLSFLLVAGAALLSFGFTDKAKAATISADRLLARYTFDDMTSNTVKAYDKNGGEVTALKGTILDRDKGAISSSLVDGIEGTKSIKLGASEYVRIEGNMGLAAEEDSFTYSVVAGDIAGDWNGFLSLSPSATAKGGRFNAGVFQGITSSPRTGDEASAGELDNFFPGDLVAWGVDSDYDTIAGQVSPPEWYSMTTKTEGGKKLCADNTFYHYVISVSKTNLIVYKNGKLIWDWQLAKAPATKAANVKTALEQMVAAMKSPTGVINIRRGFVAGDMPEGTILDDVRFYSGTATADEVAAMYEEVKSVLPQAMTKKVGAGEAVAVASFENQFKGVQSVSANYNQTYLKNA